MLQRKKSSFAVITAVTAICSASLCATAQANDADDNSDRNDNKPVHVEMFAPVQGDHAGIGGKGWFVDLALQFDTAIDKTGFSAPQITGPAGHNNVAPFPGTFSAGADDRTPGLIVLVSTTIVGKGSCQNVANLFNLTGVTDATAASTEIWDTWLVGAPNFGVDTESKIYVAVASDKNSDGVYNDAPAFVPDVNGDGICDARDLKAFGIASNIAKAKFFINP